MVKRTLRRRLRRFGRRLRYGRHARTARRVVLWGGGAVLGLSIAWILVTGLLAKQQLTKLQSQVSQVKFLVASGKIDQARHLAADIPTMARRAHQLTTGPAWWAAAQIPYLGDPIDVTRGTTVATERLGADAVPRLLDVASLIDPTKLRAHGNTIRLAPLEAAAPQLSDAASTIDRSAMQVDALPGDTWLGFVNDKRTQLVGQLNSIRGYVDAAARVAKTLPDMLGRYTPQRYFIGLQNEAELRGTGGLPGAFAIAVVRNGTISFTHFESDAVLLPAKSRQLVRTGLDFGSRYRSLYGAADPTNVYVDSNVSPHFPYAARIWAAMWQKVSGEHVDGALAVDPTALSHFLAATGPAALPGGGSINPANVVSLTERDNYAIFSDNARRKAFLVSVLRAAAHRITSGAGNALSLIQAASQSSREQRLLAWSRDPAIQKVLGQTDYAGAIPQDKRPLSALILNNAAAGKLDYYLQRSIAYSRSGCGARRDVIVTIELNNGAPASGLPAYVTTRLDNAPAGVKPGDNRTLLDYYATAGARLQSVTLNGKPSTAAVETSLGHAVFRLDVELPRATKQTIVLHLDEPAGQGTPRIWRQPGVTPLAVQEFNQSCN